MTIDEGYVSTSELMRCAYCGQLSRYRWPVFYEARCWDCWLKDHDDTRAFMSGHPWPRFHLFRRGEA